MKVEGGKTYLIDYGYLQMKATEPLSERVKMFYDFFLDKINVHGINKVALETSFLGKNAQTFLKLGYLRGILYLLASQHGLVINEFAPREVKVSITGSGAASKEQVALMLYRMFPKLSEVKSTVKNDVTDAMAICLCGVWQERAFFYK